MKEFHFKVYDEELKIWLEQFPNVSDTIREILSDFKQGKFEESKELMEKKLKLQIEKIRVDILHKKIIIRKELISMKHAPSEALDVSEGRKELTDMGLIRIDNSGKEIDLKNYKVKEENDFWCDVCKHKHFGKKADFQCTNITCFCEIRGVYP